MFSAASATLEASPSPFPSLSMVGTSAEGDPRHSQGTDCGPIGPRGQGTCWEGTWLSQETNTNSNLSVF
eukprot:5700135-Pyramimonas_sp.AAC.1